MSSERNGMRLYEIVETYADLGNHRTGTNVDAATAAWLASRLEEAGARVELDVWEFDRYHADWSLAVDGAQIDTLPLFYGPTGVFRCDAPSLQPLPLEGGVDAANLDVILAALPQDRPAVLGTEGSGSRLVALNRTPDRPTPIPVFLAAGCDLPRLVKGSVQLRLEARIELDRSANVVAVFGPPCNDPFIVTTPLTGWFRCAGERGTGIAIAIAVAAALAESHPVLFVGTTGHEIDHLGARAYLRRIGELQPRAILHLGASVAACDPNPETGILSLAARRWALTHACSSPNVLSAALAGAEVQFAANVPPPWPGEGEEWRAFGAPLLSMLGAASTFHTPDDRAKAVTTPDVLASVTEAVIAAARILPGSRIVDGHS